MHQDPLSRRHPRGSKKPNAAFTLVELVIVIVVLGALGSVALPRFIDFSAASKKAATQEGLIYLREQVQLQYLKSASSGAEAQYPSVGDLRALTRGKRPVNPFTPDGGKQRGIQRFVSGRALVNTGRGGWAYDETNGKLWANSYSGANEHTW